MGVIRHPEQRVAILIDTQNLYHSAKNLYKSKVNFGNVVETALGDRKLIRALSYVVNTETGEENAFFEALEKLGIEIKTKDLQIFFGGAKKADWDVGMAVDAIKLAHKVDAIILATGDGDFIPLAEYVKSQGCQVEAITFGRSASGKFKETVDDFIDLDEDPNRFLIGYKPNRKKGNRGLRSQIQKVVGTDTDDF
ncbi:NYN domain-containing protein [Candidatus Kaiserbacteria bacterium]|nr:NYN domain-containing protein [Candidatus Kaiserbacteria bacterium]